MAVIDHIDGPNRLIYLHVDTVNSQVRPIDIYKEMRTLRRTDENLRKFNLFMEASGHVDKGGGTFTPILVTLLDGTLIVPYDTTHFLTITGEIITDSGSSGVDCFDRTGLTPGVEVDINYVPPQVEVIEINTGSGVTPQDIADITASVWNAVLTGATFNIPASAGRRLRELGDVVSGVVNDPAASTIKFVTNLTETRDDFYVDQLVRFTSGNLEGHVRPITAYNGTTKEITVSENMVEAPDNGIDFNIIPMHVHPVEEIALAVWASADATAIEDTLATIDVMVAELHKLQGLLVGKPMTVTPTSRTVDDISQTISGDGENITTVTRNP